MKTRKDNQEKLSFLKHFSDNNNNNNNNNAKRTSLEDVSNEVVSNTGAGLQHVPNEVVSIIVNNLSDRDKAAFRETSKRMKKIVDTSLVEDPHSTTQMKITFEQKATEYRKVAQAKAQLEQAVRAQKKSKAGYLFETGRFLTILASCPATSVGSGFAASLLGASTAGAWATGTGLGVVCALALSIKYHDFKIDPPAEDAPFCPPRQHRMRNN